MLLGGIEGGKFLLENFFILQIKAKLRIRFLYVNGDVFFLCIRQLDCNIVKLIDRLSLQKGGFFLKKRVQRTEYREQSTENRVQRTEYRVQLPCGVFSLDR